jgi:alpha-glucoside transport system permease protein
VRVLIESYYAGGGKQTEHTLEEGRPTGAVQSITSKVGRLLGSLLVAVVTLIALWRVFILLRDTSAPQWVTAIVAIVWGVGGVGALFLVGNLVVEQLPVRWKRRVIPFVFVGPALVVLGWYLFLPTLRSFYISLFDATSDNFVGLNNYVYAFTSPAMRESFRNNLTWLVVGTGFSVGFGLLIAALADRTDPRFERFVMSLIFMPMAISMVGASVIWRFMYAFAPAGANQIGVLNAVVTALGGPPQAWLILRPWNTLFLIAIVIWLQTGFAMVILSAALKGIPSELLDAARIDGANELQVFIKIVIPYIRGTIVAVSTYIVIFTLKIFDVVQAMTGGNYGTQVIANEQYTQMFRAFNFGRGAAIAIVLLIAVTPVMWYNLHQFRTQTEAFR